MEKHSKNDGERSFKKECPEENLEEKLATGLFQKMAAKFEFGIKSIQFFV